MFDWMNQRNRLDSKLRIGDVSNCSDIDLPNIEVYKVYLNGNWIADCNSFEEAETIANGNAHKGSVDIERI